MGRVSRNLQLVLGGGGDCYGAFVVTSILFAWESMNWFLLVMCKNWLLYP